MTIIETEKEDDSKINFLENIMVFDNGEIK
jgi:hypothetical protein